MVHKLFDQKHNGRGRGPIRRPYNDNSKVVRRWVRQHVAEVLIAGHNGELLLASVIGDILIWRGPQADVSNISGLMSVRRIVSPVVRGRLASMRKALIATSFQ